MEIKSVKKLVEGLPERGLYGLVNIVETIYQRVTLRSSDEAQEVAVVSSTPNLRGFLVASQRMTEIETQKAMAIIVSRHHLCKAGGPH